MPSLKVPRVIMIAGVVTLAVGIFVLFAGYRMAPSVRSENDVAVNHDGTEVILALLEDTEYGLYSSDTGISCTALDPAGTALVVYSSNADRADDLRQVLGFRSNAAGNYTLSCNGEDEIVINLALLSPENTRGMALAGAFFVFGPLGLVTTTAGGIWLLLRQRRRVRIAMGRLAASPPVGAPVPYAGPGPQPDYTPAPPTTTSGAQPVTPPPGSYGLAPQQVVYRPLPPPDGGQGV